MIALPRSTYYRRPHVTAAGAERTAGSCGPVDRDAVLRDAIAEARRAHPAYGYRRVTHASDAWACLSPYNFLSLRRRAPHANAQPVDVTPWWRSVV